MPTGRSVRDSTAITRAPEPSATVIANVFSPVGETRTRTAVAPVALSETPAHIGGQINRGAPCYGEDNEWVLGELLGMSKAEITALADEGVI